MSTVTLEPAAPHPARALPISPARTGLERLLVAYVPARSVVELIDQAATLLRVSGLGIAWIASLTSVPVAIGSFWLLRELTHGVSDWQSLGPRTAVIAALLWLRHIGQGAATWGLTQVVRGSAISAARAFRAAIAEAPSLFFIGATRWIAVNFVGLFLAVPAAWLGGRWAAALPVLFEERLRYGAAMRRSGELTGSSAARYFAAMLLVGLVFCGGILCVGLFANFAVRFGGFFIGFDADFAQAVMRPSHVQALAAYALGAWVLIEPFRLCLAYVTYLDAVARVEGADLSGRLAVLDVDHAKT